MKIDLFCINGAFIQNNGKWLTMEDAHEEPNDKNIEEKSLFMNNKHFYT